MLTCDTVQRHITRLSRADARTPAATNALRRLLRIRDMLTTTEFVPQDDARFVWELDLYVDRDNHNGTGRKANRGSERMSRSH